MRRLDHIVIACENLQAGSAWIAERLGAMPDPGGKHIAMGTHNNLISLGPGQYVELIAIDPDGTPPAGRKRWYGLDDFSGDPAVVTWVARDQHFVAPPGSTIVEMTRGDLHWQFTLPDKDQMPGEGTQPLLIRWFGNGHPSNHLPDRGFRLMKLDMKTPQPTPLPRISDPRITLGFGKTQLKALIRRPQGDEVWL